MPNPDEMQHIVADWYGRQRARTLIQATLGKPDGSGGYVINAPGRPHRVYCVLRREQTIVEAINMQVASIPNLPILLERTSEGAFRVARTDEVEAAQLLGPNQPGQSVGLHSHAIGAGLADAVEGRRVLPGLVGINDGEDLTVFIHAFHYLYSGARAYWPGGTIDLTSYVPGSSNEHAWVKVGIDPSDNTATAAAGTAQSVLALLIDAQVADISFTSKIQLGAVQLANGQTQIDDDAAFADCREWASGADTADIFVLHAGDDISGRIRIQVDTAVEEALILQSTDDDPAKNIFEAQRMGGEVKVAISSGPSDGGLTSYDIEIGDANGSPTYGMMQIGNASIGRTSYKAGNIDLDGAILYRNIAGPVTSQIEHVFTESTGNTCRFALPKSGVGNATYNPRSMLIAGPAPADTDMVTVGYWQTNNNIFDNLACDTAGPGADLGVQNDLEVEGDIFADSIKESTVNAGITIPNTVQINVATLTDEALVLQTTDDDTTTAILLVQNSDPTAVMWVGADGQIVAALGETESQFGALSISETFQNTGLSNFIPVAMALSFEDDRRFTTITNRVVTFGYERKTTATAEATAGFDSGLHFDTVFNADLTGAHYTQSFGGVIVAAAKTVGTVHNIHMFGPAISGSLTNLVNLYMGDVNGATNNFAIQTNAGSVDLNAGGDGSTTFSFGGATNSFNLAADGEVTLAGTARVIKHVQAIDELGRGASAPTVRFAEVPYVSYTYAINEDSHITFEIPEDMDFTVLSTIKVHWYTHIAGQTGDEVNWQAVWNSRAPGEAVDVGATTISSGDINVPAQMIFLESTIGTIAANSIAAGDLFGIDFERIDVVDGTDPNVGSVHVLSVEFEYTSNKLGEAT